MKLLTGEELKDWVRQSAGIQDPAEEAAGQGRPAGIERTSSDGQVALLNTSCGFLWMTPMASFEMQRRTGAETKTWEDRNSKLIKATPPLLALSVACPFANPNHSAILSRDPGEMAARNSDEMLAWRSSDRDLKLALAQTGFSTLVWRPTVVEWPPETKEVTAMCPVCAGVSDKRGTQGREFVWKPRPKRCMSDAHGLPPAGSGGSSVATRLPDQKFDGTVGGVVE